MRIAIYPGTFDPVTLGHMDVIESATKIFDKVYVAILVNPGKEPFYTVKQRKDMLGIISHELGFPDIEVVDSVELMVDVARKVGAEFVVRGLRLNTDFEYELFQHFNNQMLNSDIKTVFIPPKQEHLHISSSAVRLLIKEGRDLKNYLSQEVERYVRKRDDRVSSGN